MVVQRGVEVYLYSFSNLGAKLGWEVNASLTPETDPVPVVQAAGWAPGPL
jgi:hypothetical protein